MESLKWQLEELQVFALPHFPPLPVPEIGFARKKSKLMSSCFFLSLTKGSKVKKIR